MTGTRTRIVITAGAAVVLLAAALTVAVLRRDDKPVATPAPSRAASVSFFAATDTAGATMDPAERPVELGLRFATRQAGTLTAVRFLKADGDLGPHRVTLWTGKGEKLASADVERESPAGWQEVALPAPVGLEPGREYVVSYHTSRYKVSAGWFADRAAEAGPLVTSGAGLYAYGEGDFPTQSFSSSNYWVDVVFVPGMAAPSVVPPQAAAATDLDLPRVPWEGGPGYYAKYAKKWTDPDFFPIGVWYEGVHSQADIDLDRSAGLNTYVMLTADSDLKLIRSNGMHAMTADKRPGSGDETTAWILNDEVDMWAGAGTGAWSGKYPGEGPPCRSGKQDCGFDVMTKLARDLPSGDGRMRYANFGKGIMFWQSDADASKFVNAWTTVVSNDVYWYTDPNVCGSPSEGPRLGVTPDTCRRAANYGLTMDRMREVDAMDGKRQPVYAFVEVGHPFEDADAPTITGDQIAGAVMNSIVHEARGVLYFNHNFGGDCVSQHVLRDACGAQVRPVVTELNRRIRELAPVLNTQSYEFELNPALDTMIKAHDGSFYVFAMPGREGGTGEQKLTLPLGVTGSSAEVMFEDREVPIAGGAITDTFAQEFSYHIYRIKA
ncbi:DUF4082 domain-containing protein [Symbioplanes lichenis]|uniref:DUF4082 domain-containing protein n=1 Tax=Symbioplanes lichenis TaxID=1629072 RepID=UPI00273A39C2|nr:DUF4082 domain-containing protein [Actinoplanes lichenis]